MLTKSDLAAIQKMFDSSKKETNERFESIDKRFDGMDKKIDALSNSLRKSTDDLVELITIGFNSYEKRIGRIEEAVFKTN